MSKIRVLLAGESWSSTTTHTKGFDQFFTAEFQTGIGPLQKALAGSEVDLVHLPGHLAPTQFPNTLAGLAACDVVVLSDIGANSLLLHPDSFVRGQRTPNRLRLIAEWVEKGGGFMMVGGYYSFQGINGAARYARTPIEAILPVTMLAHDDRVEVPEGFQPTPSGEAHPVLDGLGGEWPWLLGYNETTLKDGAKLLLTTGSDYGHQPLLAATQHGAGRSMAWTSDIGPHWLPQSFADWEGYRLLWLQCFAWLAGSHSERN
jgi:uncharacterized membrane protein